MVFYYSGIVILAIDELIRFRFLTGIEHDGRLFIDRYKVDRCEFIRGKYSFSNCTHGLDCVNGLEFTNESVYYKDIRFPNENFQYQIIDCYRKKISIVREQYRDLYDNNTIQFERIINKIEAIRILSERT